MNTRQARAELLLPATRTNDDAGTRGGPRPKPLIYKVRTQARRGTPDQSPISATCRVWMPLTYNNLIFLYKARLSKRGVLTGDEWRYRHRMSRPIPTVTGATRLSPQLNCLARLEVDLSTDEAGGSPERTCAAPAKSSITLTLDGRSLITPAFAWPPGGRLSSFLGEAGWAPCPNPSQPRPLAKRVPRKARRLRS